MDYFSKEDSFERYDIEASGTGSSSGNGINVLLQSASGIYSMLPLGLRMLNKIETIIDQELGAIGK